jgi:hypothetical protein
MFHDVKNLATVFNPLFTVTDPKSWHPEIETENGWCEPYAHDIRP